MLDAVICLCEESHPMSFQIEIPHFILRKGKTPKVINHAVQYKQSVLYMGSSHTKLTTKAMGSKPVLFLILIRIY